MTKKGKGKDSITKRKKGLMDLESVWRQRVKKRAEREERVEKQNKGREREINGEKREN